MSLAWTPLALVVLSASAGSACDCTAWVLALCAIAGLIVGYVLGLSEGKRRYGYKR